jgi:hypothetical protein
MTSMRGRNESTAGTFESRFDRRVHSKLANVGIKTSKVFGWNSQGDGSGQAPIHQGLSHDSVMAPSPRGNEDTMGQNRQPAHAPQLRGEYHVLQQRRLGKSPDVFKNRTPDEYALVSIG